MTPTQEHHNATDTLTFGFWIYIMSDCLLFASLFATFAVLRDNTFAGPSGKELFNMPFILAETLILLTSSFTCGLALLSMYRGRMRPVQLWLLTTFILGACFLALEMNEFSRFVAEGNSWQRSGFLSAFFTLVGTHGLHVTAGLLFLIVLMRQLAIWGTTNVTMRRLVCFSLFWHFLDIVWIFIFTFVYLFGML